MDESRTHSYHRNDSTINHIEAGALLNWCTENTQNALFLSDLPRFTLNAWIFSTNPFPGIIKVA